MTTQNNEATKEAKGITRRDFLRGGLWIALGILAIESLGATLASLWPKSHSSAASNKIHVGAITDFPVGSVTHFPNGGFFLAHVDSGFLALSQVCTHLGCIVPWKPDEKSEDRLSSKGRFNCPCHGSIFDRYGQVIVAPATRPMDLHPVTLDGDKLVVDIGTIIRRQSYEESQALRA